jgi:hypothetical protein
MKEFNAETVLNSNSGLKELVDFPKKFYEKKSVLGIDIYKYSEFETNIQSYIPVLFKYMYEMSIRNCLFNEKYLFQKQPKSPVFWENFISTGDGGFQILDNPLESLVFAIYLQANVRRYNSGAQKDKIGANLFKIVGKIELRYTITYDNLICYNNNYYGPAIIDNSRILAKDTLNRFLISEKAVEWFDINFNTIENLAIIDLNNFNEFEVFSDYIVNRTTNSLIFAKSKAAIKRIDILKIGNIKSKNTELKIYNLHLQVLMISSQSKNKFSKFLISIGNLNTKGIE